MNATAIAEVEAQLLELQGSLPLLLRKCGAVAEGAKVSVEALMVETLRFLWLVGQGPGEQLTPSRVVDLAWHELILFTADYERFCQHHYGRFLHHRPGDDGQEHAKQYRRTLQAYFGVFGAPPALFWPGVDQHLPQCGPCQS